MKIFNLLQYIHDINENKKIEQDQKLLNPNKYPIRMSDNEIQFFIDNIKGVDKYLEFGSGGSTFLVLLNSSATKIVSVESDNNWINYIKKWDLIKNNLDKKLFFEYVNIGQITMWGRPVEDDKKELFPNYSSSVFTKYENDYNLVFIDGRFRVASAIQTVLNCPNNTKILIHDYNNRPIYHKILDFLQIERTMDTMALLSPKQNIDKTELLKIYEQYKYIDD